MGRKRIEIDKSAFEKLCAIFCTEEEIAGFFNCSVDTIERWCKRTYGVSFADIYKIKCAPGKISIRRYQFQQAEHSPAMAIFLGKNYLGQRDFNEEDYTDSLDNAIEKIKNILGDTGSVIR